MTVNPTKPNIGFWIWDLKRLGRAAEAARRMQEAGIAETLVKVADGPNAFQPELAGAMIEALRDVGITVWGWQYGYGYLPEAEAQIALEMIKTHELTGFVIDAEVQYKNRPTQAKTYCKLLRSGAPNVSLALSSYRFPSLHPEFPWKEFLSYVDVNMPQVYWLGAHNPARQLERCLDEFCDAKYPQVPIIAAGAAFKDNVTVEGSTYWKATPADIREFLGAADALNIDVNFWELGNCWLFVPELWDVIADYIGADPKADPQTDPLPEIPAEKPRQEETVWLMELTSEVTSSLNLRSGPGKRYPIVGELKPGERAHVLEIDTSLAPQVWARVGVRQWCAMTYVEGGRVIQYGRFVTE